jgi:hypothetical protein
MASSLIEPEDLPASLCDVSDLLAQFARDPWGDPPRRRKPSGQLWYPEKRRRPTGWYDRPPVQPVRTARQTYVLFERLKARGYVPG